VRFIKDKLDNNLDIILYTVKDIQRIFHFSKTYTYKLIHTAGFPVIYINTEIRIPKKELEKWLAINLDKRIII
jgi:hypothetical protein